MPIGKTRTTIRLSRYVVPVAAFLLFSIGPGSSASAESPPDAGRPELSVLKSRAAAGDKRAQLELGERYERGDGVPVDLKRAARLYAAAGSASNLNKNNYKTYSCQREKINFLGVVFDGDFKRIVLFKPDYLKGSPGLVLNITNSIIYSQEAMPAISQMNNFLSGFFPAQFYMRLQGDGCVSKDRSLLTPVRIYSIEVSALQM